jgi:choline-sulfatase
MDRPDIVLFMTDQQRFDQVGYASGGHFETPNLDRIARRGVIFENAYSASTTCVPARVALMTGIEPRRLPKQENEWALREGFWTLAHELRRAGYETALIGKAHFAPVHARHGFETLRLCEHLQSQGLGPLSRERDDGLDDYHHWLLGRGYSDWRLENMGRHLKRATNANAAVHEEVRVEAFPYGPDVHPTGWVERETAEFLDRRDRTRPLFLVVSFPPPHAPYNPAEPYASMFDPEDSRLPEHRYEANDGLPLAFRLAFEYVPTRHAAADEPLLRLLLATIRGLIAHIDDAIGRLVAQLDLSSTLVAFTSDHGDYAGHRGMVGKNPWFPFDDLVRIPLFYAGYGVTSGRAVSALVQNYDFARTALDYAGVDPGEIDFDSRSVRPLLSGDAADLDRTIFSCTGMPWAMARQGDYKYIAHAEEASAMLFDLAHDPAELVNLAGTERCSEVRDHLAKQLGERVAKPSLSQVGTVATGAR